MFKGSMVAIITPMNQDGSIDKAALENLVEWHIQANTQAIIAAGTTGESATLDPDEQFEVIKLIVHKVNKRIPVIAGTGSNSTRTTLKLTERAAQAGADGCLIVTPYYNKPPQNGLYEHYKLVAENTDLPIILYNVPGRTGVDLLPETVEKLAAINNIVGIKEATGKLERAQDILARCNQDFHIYSGDDPTALTLMKHGAKGVISVTANVAPSKMYKMCKAALAKDFSLADQLDQELSGLHKDLFLEANPIPTKWALYAMGKIQENIRMPLLPLDKRYRDKVKQAMQNAGVL